MKKILYLLIALYIAIATKSQDTNSFYTHHLNDYEKELLKTYNRSIVETPPPTGQIRNIAEWEPVQSVIIAYANQFGLPTTFLKSLLSFCKVTFLVANQSEQNYVTNLLNNAGANVNNAIFVYHDVNSYWCRDYSPWFIAIDNQQVAIVDFDYNRPRPNDNLTPTIMAQHLGLERYGMNLIHTGGNWMCDGMGVAASTKLVITENPSLTVPQINRKVRDYLGIQNYMTFVDPLDDYIEHIDCWGKFLDVDKILITQVPTYDPRYQNFEAIAQYFANTNCSYGYPYKVYRVQAAAKSENQTNPYTNSLIANGKVFVPLSGSSYDAAAIVTYQQAMPGYEIVGVTYSGWYNTDALHCRTYGVPNTQMLYISHIPLFDTIVTETNLTITANIYAYGNNQIQSSYPKLYYKINDSNYHSIQMIINTKQNLYTAQIPVYEGINKISYYIEAQDIQNNTFKKPAAGSADPFVFYTSKIPNNQIQHHNKPESIKVFPNPAENIVFVKINVENQQIADIRIVDITGKTIYQSQADIMPNGHIINLSFLNIPSGVYFVYVQTQNSKLCDKLIVK